MRHKPDLIKERRRQKEAVRQKFLEKMCKQEHIEEKTVNSVSIPDNQAIKTEKQRRKAAQKKIRQLTRKLKWQKEQTDKLEKEKQKLKKRLWKLQVEEESLRKERETYKKKIDELYRVLEHTKHELSILKAEREHENMQTLKKKLRRSSRRNGDLLEHNHRLKTEISKLKQKLKTYDALLKDDSSITDHPKYRALQKELTQATGKLRRLEGGLDIPRMIEALHERLSLETVDSYNIDSLVSKVRDLSKRKNEQHRRDRLHDWMIQHLMEEDNIEPGILGFLTNDEESWLFSDLNGTVYPVSDVVTGQRPIDNMPARADIVEEAAVIQKVYNVETVTTKSPKKKSRVAVKNPDGNDYPSFGSFAVLIIGSQNKNKYVERLLKHGLTVIWHDPFEESYNRLNDKYRKADVIVVCTSHTPHAVMDHVDINDSRVELVKRDSEEALAARVRYALLQTQKLVTGRS